MQSRTQRTRTQPTRWASVRPAPGAEPCSRHCTTRRDVEWIRPESEPGSVTQRTHPEGSSFRTHKRKDEITIPHTHTTQRNTTLAIVDGAILPFSPPLWYVNRLQNAKGYVTQAPTAQRSAHSHSIQTTYSRTRLSPENANLGGAMLPLALFRSTGEIQKKEPLGALR